MAANLPLNCIFNEDCLEGMKRISSGSVDMLLTDPPYNISIKNNFRTMGRAGIDFGDWDKGFDLTAWIEYAIEKVRSGGNIVIFTDWKEISAIVKELTTSGCTVKDMIRLVKSNPMPRNKDRRFIVDYEVAVWAVKDGGKWVFNRISETYERPEIRCSVTPASEKKVTHHPTQKPLAAIEHILLRLSNPEDIVLDCFMGSGTTAIACMNTGRNYIGFELDEQYYQSSLQRIEQHKAYMKEEQ